MINKDAHVTVSYHMILKHMFPVSRDSYISFHPRTSPVWKSSRLTPVLRNVPPQDCKNWLAHQPILSPGNGQESSGILQEYVGDNKALLIMSDIHTSNPVDELQNLSQDYCDQKCWKKGPGAQHPLGALAYIFTKDIENKSEMNY